jgi:hypothetical protein
MVLAIGIVVDDAIVVVENVERVMEEHPELSPGIAALIVTANCRNSVPDTPGMKAIGTKTDRRTSVMAMIPRSAGYSCVPRARGGASWAGCSTESTGCGTAMQRASAASSACPRSRSCWWLTPGMSFRSLSTSAATALVRATEAPSGSWTETKKAP